VYGSVARFPLSQLLNRSPDPELHGFPFHITGSKARVGPHGGFNVGCVAVLLDELVGGAVDVEIGGHLALPATALIMAAR